SSEFRAANQTARSNHQAATAPVETLRLFTNYSHPVARFYFTDFESRLLAFVTHRDDILSIPAQQRAPTGGACWRSGERRLLVRPRQPGLRGPRESPPGPT